MTNFQFKFTASSWHKTPLGKQLIESIDQQLKTSLPTIFGFYLLQMGKPEYTHWLDCSPIKQKIVITPTPTEFPTSDIIQSHFHQLPFSDNSIDAIFLPCLLEVIPNPIQILEEIWRVLLPSGTLILIGFNPWSLWGLTHAVFYHFLQEFPWEGNYFSCFQLSTWLTECNFTVETKDYFYFRPPLTHSEWHKKLDFLEKIGTYCYHSFGGLYHIVATKHVAPVTPIKQKWKIELIEPSLANPTPH